MTEAPNKAANDPISDRFLGLKVPVKVQNLQSQQHRTMCRAAYLATSLPPWPSNTANRDVGAAFARPEALGGGGSKSSCTTWASSCVADRCAEQLELQLARSS
jgi:hypothetical protein